jgi:hypothetical protein
VAARTVARWATQRRLLAVRTESAESWLRYAAWRVSETGQALAEILEIWPTALEIFNRVHEELAD